MPSGYQVEIELKGFEEFKEKLRQAPDIVADVKYKMMDAMVTIAREKAHMEAPIDTGNLRKNIVDNSKVVTMGNDLYGVVGTTITSKGGFPYPQVQEYGSGIYGPKRTPIITKRGKKVSGVKPKYFMKKAAEEVKRRRSEILKIGLEIVNKLSFSS